MTITIDGLYFTQKSEIAEILSKRLSLSVVNVETFYKAIGFYFLQNGVSWTRYNKKMLKLLKNMNLRHEFIKDQLVVFINNLDYSSFLSLTLVEETSAYYSCFEDLIIYLSEYFAKYFANKSYIFVGKKSSYLFRYADFHFFFESDLEERIKQLNDLYDSRGDVFDKKELPVNLYFYDKTDKSNEFFPIIPSKKSVVLNTSYKTLNASAEKIIKIVESKIYK